MKVNELRKKCLKLGIIFTIAGGIVTAIGFGISGFDLNAYRTDGEINDMFRTINW
ncbi:hypothetical protein BACPU_13640 [Bacillus pumilus]|nr:hypothetical protein BACPU_13640 [Bacillus pumilus]